MVKINQKQGPSLLPCSSDYSGGPVLNYPLVFELAKRTEWLCTISTYDRLLPTTITTTTMTTTQQQQQQEQPIVTIE
ncbi:hypothetical protein HZH68_005750 [Vespula germanica]|uniref:Uncharacterized protein n=1 Tax=Vespula germanica TaxID=30212 RepID=A0A834KLT0_VESGE|nr:hypothetical protein HZH68_005750 [Vespula germanica]